MAKSSRSRPRPVKKKGGARRVNKKGFRGVNRNLTLKGFAVKVALLLRYALDTEAKFLSKWLTLEIVDDVRKLWFGSNRVKSRSFKANLLKDDDFHTCANDATFEPQRRHLMKPLDFQPHPLIINGKQFVKSDNSLHAKCGFPKELYKDTEMRSKNCCINSWVFVLQLCLKSGFKKAFLELTENIKPESKTGQFVRSLLTTNGNTSHETEIFKTQFIVENKSNLVQKSRETEEDLFKLWGQDVFNISTLRAKFSVCTVCGFSTSIQHQSNITKHEFLQLIGQVEATADMSFCSECLIPTLHKLHFVLGSNIIYVDAEYSQEPTEDVKQLLMDWPDQVTLPGGVNMELIATPSEEWYSPCRGHQLVMRRTKDGELRAIDDSRPDIWEESYQPDEWTFDLTGALYGVRDKPHNASPTASSLLTTPEDTSTPATNVWPVLKQPEPKFSLWEAESVQSHPQAASSSRASSATSTVSSAASTSSSSPQDQLQAFTACFERRLTRSGTNRG